MGFAANLPQSAATELEIDSIIRHNVGISEFGISHLPGVGRCG